MREDMEITPELLDICYVSYPNLHSSEAPWVMIFRQGDVTYHAVIIRKEGPQFTLELFRMGDTDPSHAQWIGRYDTLKEVFNRAVEVMGWHGLKITSAPFMHAFGVLPDEMT